MHEKEMVMPLTEDMCVGSTYPPRNESFEERQLRLLESIDRKLGQLVDSNSATGRAIRKIDPPKGRPAL